MRTLLAISIMFAVANLASAQEPTTEKARYLRLGGKSPVPECEFTLERSAMGWFIRSVTERGGGRLEVAARYDKDDRLVSAAARLTGKQAGKARVKRDGKEAQEFDVPPGVIVTSAPDWTDTFLLCRRYDRKKGGEQHFAGLWIHPEQPAQRPTFRIVRHGTSVIEHQGENLFLECYHITLRPKSDYRAWTDAKGRMIKLMPLPISDKSYSLVLEGFEKSAAGLESVIQIK